MRRWRLLEGGVYWKEAFIGKRRLLEGGIYWKVKKGQLLEREGRLKGGFNWTVYGIRI